MGLTRVTESMSVRQAREGLTNYMLPSTDGGWRDIYRSGWLPSWFNQQWGGAQWGTEMQDAATGVTYKFDVATGSVEDLGDYAIGNAAAYYFQSQGFKVSETTVINAIWVKLYKIGTANRTFFFNIYTDSSGSPSSVVASSNTTSLNLMQITSKADGEWYRLPLSVPVTLTANTQYHLVANYATVDASNYLAWKRSFNRKYPHGYRNSGTSAPVWTPTTTDTFCFLMEPSSTYKFLQTSGQFDKKLVFGDLLPVNQSKALTQPMKNFFDGSVFTYLVRGASWQKGKPVADFVYGLDHDRISVTTDGTSGVAKLTVYNSTGVSFTITGTTDLSTAGNKDIAVAIRAVGDTSDYIKLYVNGAVEGVSVTGQAIVFDSLFRELGTAWLGGGFPLAPTWTVGSLASFTSLPSAQGWTWIGTATEANAMSIANGKLYQNKNGYASTDTGFYAKTSVGLNNTTGWTVSAKLRVSSTTNIPLSIPSAVFLGVRDGAKVVLLDVNEYFVSSLGASSDFTYQIDSKFTDIVFTICGKGVDYYIYANGKLIIDGTGKLISTSALNQIEIGNGTSTTGETADAIWSYVKYYTGGMIIPQASTGASVSETVFWSGDKTPTLKDLYNAGSPISAKTYMGFERNYVGEGVIQE